MILKTDPVPMCRRCGNRQMQKVPGRQGRKTDPPRQKYRGLCAQCRYIVRQERGRGSE